MVRLTFEGTKASTSVSHCWSWGISSSLATFRAIFPFRSRLPTSPSTPPSLLQSPFCPSKTSSPQPIMASHLLLCFVGIQRSHEMINPSLPPVYRIPSGLDRLASNVEASNARPAMPNLCLGCLGSAHCFISGCGRDFARKSNGPKQPSLDTPGGGRCNRGTGSVGGGST
jgi:hypothetical protein